MTRAEYAAKFGQPPPIPAASPASAPEPSLGEKALSVAKKLPGAQLGDEIGNSIYSLGKAGGQALKGNFVGAGKTLQEGVSAQHPVKTVADTVQAAATPATLLVGGGEGLAAKTFLGRTTANAAAGALTSGAGAAAQGKGTGDVLKEAALGGAFSGLGGAASEIPGAIQASKEGRVAAAVDGLEAKYRELAGTTTKTSKLLDKSNKATEAKNLAGTTGKPVERTLAEAGIIPKQDPQNPSKLATFDQAEEFRKSTQPLHDALGQAIRSIKHDVPPVPMNALETSAIHRVMGQPLTEGDKLAMVNGIKKEFKLLRSKHGDSMTIEEMHDTKSPYWGKTKFDSTKPLQGDINYQIGKSFQKGVEDTAMKGGYEDVAQLNREIGDRLEGAKFLEGMNGKIVKKGQLGKYALAGIGAIAGSSGGPLGTIVGGVLGDAAANMLISRAVSTQTKRLILKHLEQKDPAAYIKTIKFLEKQNLLKDSQLALPAGPELGQQGNPHIVAPRETSGVVPGSSR